MNKWLGATCFFVCGVVSFVSGSVLPAQTTSLFTLPTNESQIRDWKKQLAQSSDYDWGLVPSLATLAHEAIDAKQFALVPEICGKIEKIALFNERPEVAVQLLDRLMERLPLDRRKEIGAICNLLGNAYRKQFFLTKSLECYSRSIEQYRRSSNPGLQSVPLGNIASIYEDEKQFKKAIECNKRSLNFSLALNEPDRSRKLMQDHFRLANNYRSVGESGSAKRHYESAIQVARRIDNLDIRVHAFSKYISFLIDNQELVSAEPLVVEVQNWLPQLTNTIGIEEFLGVAARFEIGRGNLQKANEYFQQIQFYPAGCRGADEYYRVAQELFSAQGDVEKAYLAQSKLLEILEDKIDESEKQRKSSAGAVAKYEIEKQTAELMADSLLNQAQANRRIRNMIIAFTLLGGLFGFVWYRSFTKRSAEKSLLAEQQRINDQLAELVDERTAELVAEIQERTPLEKALENKRRIEAIGQLTGGVAHDFNNLLQVILTTNSLLEMVLSENLDPKYKELLATSSRSAEAGTQIVQQLLAFARQQHLSPAVLDVGEFFDSRISLLKTAVGERISLSLENAGHASLICADSAQLTTSMINLISNASDAMKEIGSTISIHVRNFETRDLEKWSWLSDRDHVVIEVTDDGSGMTPDQLVRACDPFYTTKQGGTGTGLGLSSVLGFVKQSDGDLHIESSHGFGTIVSLAFPKVAARVSALPANDQQASHLESMKILLVEDNASVRSSLQLKLESLNLSVESCESAAQAIQMLNHGKFDCVLSDIRMPGKLDGIGLANWIREHTPETPIILMTGFNHRDFVAENAKTLIKPFSNQQLIKVLHESRTAILERLHGSQNSELQPS